MYLNTYLNTFVFKYCPSLSIYSLKFDYDINDTKLESEQCVKDLDVTVASSLKFSQQCKDATGKANRMLDFINFSFKK